MTQDIKAIAEQVLARAEPYSERQIAEAEGYASAYCDPRDFPTQSARNSVWIGVRAGYLQKCNDLSDVLTNAKELARAHLALLELIDKEISISDAVEILCKELLKDEGYYISWKANIAMAFYDECERRGIKGMHEAANVAAKYFLSNLTRLEKARAITPKAPDAL